MVGQALALATVHVDVETVETEVGLGVVVGAFVVGTGHLLHDSNCPEVSEGEQISKGT